MDRCTHVSSTPPQARLFAELQVGSASTDSMFNGVKALRYQPKWKSNFTVRVGSGGSVSFQALRELKRLGALGITAAIHTLS